MTAPALYIGLMSGSSIDGVDAVLAEINENGISSRLSGYTGFELALKNKLRAMAQSPSLSLDELNETDTELTRLYAKAVHTLLDSAGIPHDKITAIGCHGQTIRHRPDIKYPYTLQLGNPHLLAELTGIDCVSDFRRRDIAAGGQGAPLVPAFHQALLAKQAPNCVVLNLGGIANISILHDRDDCVTGYDTGPANILMDAWCQQELGRDYDKEGELAAQGKVQPDLLERMTAHPFLHQPPPKSTGREDFNITWLNSLLADRQYEQLDVLTTLAEFTASSVTEALKEHSPRQVIVCGGGAHNRFLISRMQNLMPGVEIESSQFFGIDPDYMEALAFAWLAYRCLNQLAGNAPRVTGAKGSRILGSIVYA